MIEVVRHTLGFCGEGHPHLLNLSVVGFGVAGGISYIKSYLKTKIKLWKNQHRLWENKKY
jgi:hypothetical protein